MNKIFLKIIINFALMVVSPAVFGRPCVDVDSFNLGVVAALSEYVYYNEESLGVYEDLELIIGESNTKSIEKLNRYLGSRRKIDEERFNRKQRFLEENDFEIKEKGYFEGGDVFFELYGHRFCNILVIRGSVDQGDILKSLKIMYQGRWFYDNARSWINKTLEINNNSNKGLLVLGHSLGGGVAQVIGAHTDNTVITFNSIGLGKEIIATGSGRKKDITNYSSVSWENKRRIVLGNKYVDVASIMSASIKSISPWHTTRPECVDLGYFPNLDYQKRVNDLRYSFKEMVDIMWPDIDMVRQVKTFAASKVARSVPIVFSTGAAEIERIHSVYSRIPPTVKIKNRFFTNNYRSKANLHDLNKMLNETSFNRTREVVKEVLSEDRGLIEIFFKNKALWDFFVNKEGFDDYFSSLLTDASLSLVKKHLTLVFLNHKQNHSMELFHEKIVEYENEWGLLPARFRRESITYYGARNDKCNKVRFLYDHTYNDVERARVAKKNADSEAERRDRENDF